MDSAYVSSLTEQADQRTPEQHLSWFCLSPKPSGKSILAELIGWKLASTICHKALTPVLRRGKAATLPTPSIASSSNVDRGNVLSRRQKAQLAGKNKTVGSSSKNESMSDGVSERSRCSDPGKQSPARADEESTQPAAPGLSATDAQGSSSDRPTSKRSAKTKRPLVEQQSTSSTPPRKFQTYEVTSDGKSTPVTMETWFANKSSYWSRPTPEPTPAPPPVTDDDLVDIIRCTRRMNDPVQRGKFISDVLSQCSKMSQLAAQSDNGQMRQQQHVPGRSSGKSVASRPPVSGSFEGSRMKPQKAERSIDQQLSRPMYRYLTRGGPPGEKYCNDQ